MIIPAAYCDSNKTTLLSEKTHSDGRVVKKFAEKQEIVFANGVRRVQFNDGYQIIYFENGDIRQTYPDGKVVYWFAKADVTQTILPGGEKILLFANQ